MLTLGFVKVTHGYVESLKIKEGETNILLEINLDLTVL
jgi:hypothetical protein